MGLQKLIESSKKFKFDEVYWYDGGEIARQSFLEKFPLNSLKDLFLDQYVQGTDKESFCYWLEFKKKFVSCLVSPDELYERSQLN